MPAQEGATICVASRSTEDDFTDSEVVPEGTTIDGTESATFLKVILPVDEYPNQLVSTASNECVPTVRF